MRRIIYFLLLLTVAVFCSACINYYAVQKLNEIAAQYINEGNIQGAIARLESSVDLDGTIYESRYNLAVAYLRNDNCEKALEQIKVAENLKNNEAAVYYTKGAIYNCLAEKIYNKDNTDNFVRSQYRDAEFASRLGKEYIDVLKETNDAYDKYLQMAQNTEETQQITDFIRTNQNIIDMASK